MKNGSGALTEDIAAVVQRAMQSLVLVERRPGEAGAGFVWSASGWVLTNDHVVGDGPLTVRLNDDREFEARVLLRDAAVDLAMLAIPASNLLPLPRAAGSARIGDWTLALGHPWGLRNMVSHGIVSAFVQADTRDGRQIDLLRTDVRLAPGNSGGPLLNAAGEAIGVNAMILGGDQSLAIPIGVVESFAKNL
jgi:serine protease Do